MKAIKISKEDFDKLASEVIEEMNKKYADASEGKVNSMGAAIFTMQNMMIASAITHKLFDDEVTNEEE